MNKFRLGLYGMMCAAIGIIMTFVIESLVIFCGQEMPMVLFPLLIAAVSGVLFFCVPKSFSRLIVILMVLCGSALIGAGVLHGNAHRFRTGWDYQNADESAGVKTFFADKRIMLIVPHQDDDLNVLGGTIEEYVRYGSEVYVVYVTNGDMTPAEIRYTEAIDCLAKQGIPEECVIFLGYGDQWQEDGPHIYNAEPGAIVRSRAGYLATYGISDHPAYHDGSDYTIDNLLSDMESVILEYRPDVIFSCDYDEHSDHKATSLVFEKAMGRILRGSSDYRPKVFKGFAYRTAWNNGFDYYSLNLKSTQNSYEEGFEPQVEYYRWEDRVRFPVDASGLSRSLLGSRAYHLLDTYVSQNAYQKAQGVINGDKVFWERFTTSLCNRAEITVSSGDPGMLNDFMLLENSDIIDKNRLPYDGVWIPEAADMERKVSVILPERSDLTSVVLYDHPSPDHNVLEAIVSFDNGERLVVGPLDPIGSPTMIVVDQKQVACFDVELTLTEGDQAGLTEIEAFSGSTNGAEGFVQLMDTNGDFVYDYISDPSGEVVLLPYCYGGIPEVSPEQYNVFGDNDRCEIIWSEQGIVVACPPGESVSVSITSQDGVWDRAYIRNPGRLSRAWIKACQLAELFGLELPTNEEKDEILQHFVVERFQRKLWNLYYRVTH